MANFTECARAVEVERRRLEPRVVRVARVVHVAAVDVDPMLEELIGHLVEGRNILLPRQVASFLFELATHLPC